MGANEWEVIEDSARGLPSELVGMILGKFFQQQPSKRVRLRAGLENPLHQVLVRDNCPHCGKSKKCRLRDVIAQPDYAGMDYCDGSEVSYVVLLYSASFLRYLVHLRLAIVM